MNEIEHALSRLFDRHRVVFWYDLKQELQAEYEAVALPGVEKVKLDNNQFGVKYRILRQEPQQKFLLYQVGPPPDDLDNWLLDVELAHGRFSADQNALWLTELGLGLEFTDVVAPHSDFFHSARRREALKRLLHADDTPRQVQLKMAAVCAAADPRLDDILANLLAELAAGKEDKMRLLQRCALDEFLWQQLERAYGYTSDSPGLQDFKIELFKSGYAMGLAEPARLANDALVFLKSWKDSVRHHQAFEILSGRCAEILNVEQDLHGRDYRRLVELDTFELVDRKILSDLVRDVAGRTITAADCQTLIRQRRQTHWYGRYENAYEAIEHAALFLHTLDQVDLTVRSLAAGIEQYGRVWFRLDQLYRKFIYHLRCSGQPTLLAPLTEQIENLYTNNYLLKLNDQWQPFVDACARWDIPPFMPQASFFAEKVQPFLNRGNKIFIIISDALRYEIAEELLRLIRQEDRYEATLEPAVTVLPSFTQLGMAALLPHEPLSFSRDGAKVMSGSLSSQGSENRKKIVEQALPGRGAIIRADTLLAMSREESRALARDHDVVYVYHNRIDAAGDKRETEEQVFDAAEATLNELILLIKKLANANASNMLVVADHGFIYQHRVLDESDFLGAEPQGEQILVRNRRFVLGRGLVETPGFKKFTAAAVGLQGDMEILLPKSINRLRVRGAGSRYVHGGAALQEVVIPVVQINKKRESDVSQVAVDILRSGGSVITSGQLTVILYQAEAVTDKLQPRQLRAGIYTQDGALISDQHELNFDLTAADPRRRELPVRFILTQRADAANGQEVSLRLEERVADTSHYREYRSAHYLLRRSFTSDFDI
jgi:uncharacterized protein (TIGR02687 family)